MIIGKQSGLGRGLGALIPPAPAATPASTPAPTMPSSGQGKPSVVSGPPKNFTKPTNPVSLSADLEARGAVMEIPLSALEPNPRQPRRQFEYVHLEELVASIKEHGILQPILVRKLTPGKYQLIAGERRFRAASLAGLKMVPAIVRDATDQQRLELALIENIQRQDLNPIEEARAYQALNQEFELTQEEIAKKVGKSRSQITNMTRLLQLSEEMQQALIDGRLSPSNGRTLLGIESEKERMKLFEAMLAGRFTVRDALDHVAQARPRRPLDPNVRAAEEQVRSFFDCKVKIRREPKGDGEIRLRFYSDEELNAILEKLHQDR